MIRRLKNSEGDTIIEVLLAMTLLTLIMFTAWGLVNRATRISLDARKRIEMVNQLKEQAEILKSIYTSNGGELKAVTKVFSDKSIPFNSEASLTYDQSFCIQPFAKPVAASFSPGGAPSAEARDVNNDQTGYVWIQYRTYVDYSDFYIRGCWQTGGSQQTLDNSQIIVRLNK